MPKSLKVKVGNAAKSRQHTKGIQTGKYVRQRAITEANRRRKWRKHLKAHPNHIKGMEHIRKLLEIE